MLQEQEYLGQTNGPLLQEQEYLGQTNGLFVTVLVEHDERLPLNADDTSHLAWVVMEGHQIAQLVLTGDGRLNGGCWRPFCRGEHGVYDG